MRTLVLTVCGLTAAAAQAQTGTLDQSSPHSASASNGAIFNAGSTTLVWQQQIRPTLNGQLEGLRITHTGPAGSMFRVAVRDGAALSTNAVLFETTITRSVTNVPETVFLDMTGANIVQTAGSAFVMEVNGFGNGSTDTPWIYGSYIDPAAGDPLYPEPLFLGTTEFVPGWKLGFDSFVIGSTCAADFNGDDVVDFFDYLDFVQAFSGEEDAADFNDDGVIDFFDYLDFVQAFSEGCGG